ncbi:AAA family ATPase [bacterium]|nr:AAA family ATPase [bacterium]
MIGRAEEIAILNGFLDKKGGFLTAMIGRRRVGKTYMIRHIFKEHIVFEFTGTQYANRANQLQKFSQKLQEFRKGAIALKEPTDWAEAFMQLKAYLQGLRKTKKKPVVFFDELPWIDSRRSGFLQEFGYWWNDWACKQEILVVICGSTASWMIEKVINNKGGLHNRVHRTINLKPFTIAETDAFLKAKNIKLDAYNTVLLYMTLGGIPFYLEQVEPGETATQAINRLCFSKNGGLANEFDNLYAALYEHPQNHVAIIKALKKKWKGLTRQQIIKATGIANGGGLTKVLNELVASTFVIEVLPFGKKKKDTLFRLADEYSLFYLQFMEGKGRRGQDDWMQTFASQTYKTWCGYAFENICLKHETAIKKALGISGIKTEVSSFAGTCDKNGDGMQIDMLIDRADKAINLCEIKFYADAWKPTERDVELLRKRRERFRQLTGTKKMLINTAITTYGVAENTYTKSQIDKALDINLFFT